MSPHPTMSNCSKKNRKNTEPKDIYECDYCKKKLCNSCSGISPTEERAMALQNRKLRYSCPDCLENFISYERLLQSNKKLIESNNKLESLLQENCKFHETLTELVRKVGNLDSRVYTIEKGKHDPPSTSERCVTELKTRQHFESNCRKVIPKNDVPNKTHGEVNSKQGYASATKTNPNKINSLEIHQRNLMQDIINLENSSAEIKEHINKTNDRTEQNRTKEVNSITDELQNTEQNTNDKDGKQWEVPRRRSRKFSQRRSKVGQSEENLGNFRGVKPKVWMYLYRIEPEVTEDDIKQYLKSKCGNDKEEFIVKDLKENGRLKTYMVAGDFSYKDKFYDPGFWPKGIRFKRFDFILQRQKNVNCGQATQPNSFLDI